MLSRLGVFKLLLGTPGDCRAVKKEEPGAGLSPTVETSHAFQRGLPRDIAFVMTIFAIRKS